MRGRAGGRACPVVMVAMFGPELEFHFSSRCSTIIFLFVCSSQGDDLFMHMQAAHYIEEGFFMIRKLKMKHVLKVTIHLWMICMIE